MNKNHTTRTTLDALIAHKREEIAQYKQSRPRNDWVHQAFDAPPPRDFLTALQVPGVSLIAQVKQTPPSQNGYAPTHDPVTLARTYADNGAAAISMLTEAPCSHHNFDSLHTIHQAVTLPVLYKALILDLYQLYAARAADADAVLLIVAILDDATLHNLYALTRHLGMTAMVEVHNHQELRRALTLRPRLISITHHDLNTVTVNPDTLADLRPRLPSRITVVAECDIHTPDDVARLVQLDVDAMLVGDALIAAEDAAGTVRSLVTEQNVP